MYSHMIFVVFGLEHAGWKGLEHTTAETPPKTSFVPDRYLAEQRFMFALRVPLMLSLRRSEAATSAVRTSRT
jgi:hypothetical protein